jgi:hypothetical protein
MSAPAHRPKPDIAIPLDRQSGASLRERLVDTLAQILLETDEALSMLSGPEANGVRWIEPHLQTVFDEVNAVLLRLSD